MRAKAALVTHHLRSSLVVLLFILPLHAQIITTTAGGYVGDGGPATAAAFNYPRYTAQDAQGNLYISDSFNHRIRKVAPNGVISTFAGTGIAGFSGDGGLARNAMFSFA